MFTDIVGSTALRDALVAAHGGSEGNRRYREQLLDPHNERIRSLLAEHHGFEVKTIGDAFMVAFGSAEDAVRCAVAIQRSLRDEPIETLAVRIGMHTGAATLVEHEAKPDYDGDAVNIAARVESLLKGGGRIYCSRDTAALAKIGAGIRYHSYGPYILKGVSEQIEIIDVLWDDAMQPDPPAQSHERLPYPWLTPWVGRKREMTALDKALRASPLVTLHGMGGVGKTRLAVETLLARGSGLPREIVFVSLERASDLLVAVRDALDITEVDAPDLAALCKYLRGGDRLLLLDNFESMMAAAADVPRLATTAGVRVLATSQRALEVPGERVVELEPMPAKTKEDLSTLESFRLFVMLAQQRDARWQPDDDTAMRDVLAATDGLPYLIELVAAVAPKRRLRQLADELKTRRAPHPLKERHGSVQACLEWALDRLPAEERQALPRLAIFAGGFDEESARDIAATSLSSLDILVDASLLRFDRETGRYSMLPTTREFTRERLSDEERSRLAAAHAQWFIERLDRADDALRAKGGEAQAAARRWIGAEYDNIQQAVECREMQEPELFAAAVFAFGIYLIDTCRFSEFLRLNETLVSRLNFKETPTTWAKAQTSLGIAYRNLRTGDRSENLTKAIICYEEALSLWTQNDFPADWSMTQNNLGNAYSDLWGGDRGENLSKAISYYEAALSVRTETAFPLDWALVQNNLGVAYCQLPTGDRSQNLAKAIDFYEAALRVWTEDDFPSGWAVTQHNLGIAYANLPTGVHSENLARAITCYKAALRVLTEDNYPRDWANTQYDLGAAYERLAVGEPGPNRRQAIQYYESAARGYAAIGFTKEMERALAHAATLTPSPAENSSVPPAC